MTTGETNALRIFERRNVKKIYGWAHKRRRMLHNKNKDILQGKGKVIPITGLCGLEDG